MTSWPRLQDLHTIVFDFDGVFTDNGVYVSSDGQELVRCDRADGLGMDILRAATARIGHSIDSLILSTERNAVVAARAKKLALACTHGVGNKLDTLSAHFRSSRPHDQMPWNGAMFLCNDLNDLSLARRVRFSVAPSDAHPLLKSHVSAVLPERGGHGFVRAAVERLVGVDALAADEVVALLDCRGDPEPVLTRR